MARIDVIGILQGPIARSTTSTTAVLILRIAVQAAALLLLARLLGPAGFGAFAGIAALAILVGSMATFGSHWALLRDLSNDAGRTAERVPVALAMTAACGSGSFLLYLVLSTLLLDLTSYKTLIVAVSIGLSEVVIHPLLLISAVPSQASGRIAWSQVLMLLPSILRLLSAVALLLTDSEHVLLLYSLGYLVASTLGFLVSWRQLPAAARKIRNWRFPKLSEWRESSHFALISLSAAGPTEVDKTVAVRALPLEFAGIYAAASRVMAATILPVLAMMLSALPRLFADTGNGTLRHRLLSYIFMAASLYGLAAGTCIWLLAPTVEIVFGDNYAGIGQTLRLLAYAAPLLCLRISAANVMMAVGRPWVRIAVELGSMGTLAVLATWLATTSLGISGMAIALACSEGSAALVLWSAIALGRSRLTTGPSKSPS